MKRSLFAFTALLLLFCLALTACQCPTPKKMEPKLKEGEFPFTLVYEIDGVTHTVENAVTVSFAGYDESAFLPMREYPRLWHSPLKEPVPGDAYNIVLLRGEGTPSLIRKDTICNFYRVVFSPGRGDYYMGETEDVQAPHFYYHEEYQDGNVTYVKYIDLTEEKLEERFGIRILRVECSPPIVNTFYEVTEE